LVKNQACKIPLASSRRALAWRAQACILALFGVLAAAAPGSAQTLRARLLDADTNTPIAGAFAILSRPGDPSTGARAGASLSDSQGWLQLRAPGPGSYLIRVERLGYATYTSEPFRLDSVMVREIRISAEAIALPAITAAGRRRCGGVAELAAEAAVLWEEVQKALSVSVWTASERSVSYLIQEYSRRLHPRTLEVLEERTEHQALWSTGSPFVARNPRDLAERGFIRARTDGWYEYYGPDSEVILSEWFLERHCFRAVSNRKDPDMIGLAFEPGPGAPTYDIQGVLWLDRASAQLRYLEYSYSRLPARWNRYPRAARSISSGWLPGGGSCGWWIRALLSRTGHVSQWSRGHQRDRSQGISRRARQCVIEEAELRRLVCRRLCAVERLPRPGGWWRNTAAAAASADPTR
jgi:hypothetical protein